tara:strand:+ start:2369 stop:3370 length:1002 start_codon:yes stop_codon:yes gene_type:complete
MDEQKKESGQNDAGQETEVVQNSSVLAPLKYGWKVFVIFADILALVGFMYFYMIKGIFQRTADETFSWGSMEMIAFYIFIGFTVLVPVIFWLLRKKGAIRTRIDKENEIRQNPSIHVWLVVFDWTRLVVFLPTIIFLVVAALVSWLTNVIVSEEYLVAVQRCIGGVVIAVFVLNTLVVLFEFTWTKIGFVLGSLGFFTLLVILSGLFSQVFGKLRYLGVSIEPLGYLLIAYVLLNFLRLIWLNGLFDYVVFTPNRLDVQEGSSESGKGTKSSRFNVSVDTHDAIERAFGLGCIRVNFMDLDKDTINLNVWGVQKKSKYAVAAASATSIDSPVG